MNFSDLSFEDRLSSNAFLFLSFVFANSRLEQIFNEKFQSKDHFLKQLESGQYSFMLTTLFEVFNSYYLEKPQIITQSIFPTPPKVINKQPYLPQHSSYQFTQTTAKTNFSTQKKNDLERSIRDIIQKDFQPLKRQISQPKSIVAESPQNKFQKQLEQLFNEQNFNRFSFGLNKDEILKKDQNVSIKSPEKKVQSQNYTKKSELELLQPQCPPTSEQINKNDKYFVPKTPPKTPKSPYHNSHRSHSQSPSNQDSRNYIPIDELPKKKKASLNSQRNFNILTNEEIQ